MTQTDPTDRVMARVAQLTERVARLKDSDGVSESDLRGVRHSYDVLKPKERRAAERKASIRYVPHPAVARMHREKAERAEAERRLAESLDNLERSCVYVERVAPTIARSRLAAIAIASHAYFG